MNNFAIIEYLENRIQQDEAFLLAHQDELNVEDPEHKEIYEVTQGKVDMCRQILGYLEDVRKNPDIVTNALQTKSD